MSRIHPHASAGWLTLLTAVALMLTSSEAAAQQQPNLDQVVSEVIDSTNAYRQSQGLAPTRPQPALHAAAAGLAQFMARTDQYGHRADGRLPSQRTTAAGYAHCMVAENIAFQQRSEGFSTHQLARAVVQGWQASPPHRRNMLDGAVTETGVALAYSPASGRYYAVQLFGRPFAARLSFKIENGTGMTLAYELDGEEYLLRPGAQRAHRSCGSGQLRLQRPSASSEPQQAIDGGHYVARQDASGRLRWTRR